MVAFFGCLYYAAARPAEVIELSLEDCDLPRRGWGVVRLRETRPRSGSAWTDSGTAHDRRGLKHRPRKAIRTVPTPFADAVALAPKLFDFLTLPKPAAPGPDPMGAVLSPAKALIELPSAARTGFEPITETAQKAFNKVLRDVTIAKPNS